MTILALDLGTKIGWYVEGNNKAHTFDLGKGDDRFYSFRNFLDNYVFDAEVTSIAYEAAAFQRGNAIPIYHGLVAILKDFCIHNNIPYKGIPVGTIKKYFTGKGNTNKKGIMAECDKRGYQYDDDNAADAIATYHTYVELYGGNNEED